MIRHAVDADRDRCLVLLRQSHDAAGFPWSFRGANAAALFRYHAGNPDACCIVLDVEGVAQGVLMAAAFEHPFGAGRWAKETVWFVAEAHRGRGAIAMLDAYEAWAKARGCIAVGMASLASNDVSALYQRRGYAPAEMHFLKFI